MIKSPHPLSWLTAYDFKIAQILEQSEIDAILVGDSLAMTFYGAASTQAATMAMMIYHTQAVKNGAPTTKIITDLPYQSYQNPNQALANSQKLIQAGAQAVKLEGGAEVLKQVQVLTANKIEVIGHLGLTPQTIQDWKVQGREQESAEKIMQAALNLEQAGISHLVLECIPETLGQTITQKLTIPTIGIGAGRYCSGQVLVFDDLVGLSPKDFRPKFLKRYLESAENMQQAVKRFKDEVRKGVFPAEGEVYR